MLCDADDEVARTAWRVAVALVPEDDKKELVDEFVKQFGRGDRHTQMSLSRALVDLGDVLAPALDKVAMHPNPAPAAHACATERQRSCNGGRLASGCDSGNPWVICWPSVGSSGGH